MPRTAKKRKAQALIDRMVKRIVKRFRPHRIILFGSQARGDAGPECRKYLVQAWWGRIWIDAYILYNDGKVTGVRAHRGDCSLCRRESAYS
jgi:hypothetical protein